MKIQPTFATTLARVSRHTYAPTMKTLLASFALALAPFAPAAPFQNGSFELNGGNASSTATGWTQSGPAIKFHNVSGATDGAFAALFNPGGEPNGSVLSQTFDTVTSQLYTVTFDWGNLGSDATQRLKVEVRDPGTGDELITVGSGTTNVVVGGSGVLIEGNTNVFIISDSTGKQPTNGPAPNVEFSVFSFAFRAESASVTLSFTDQGTGDLPSSDGVLDNVRLVESPGTNWVLSLDGTSGYVTVPSAADLQTGEITVEMWMYPTQTANQFGSFINKGDGQSGDSQRTYEARWQSGILNFAFYFGLVDGLPAFATLSAPVSSNQWTHVAATFSSSAGSIQLLTNGVLAVWATNLNGTPIQGRGLRQTTLPLVFGWTPYFANIYASGYMDEIRVWTKARSAQEINGTMSCRLTGAEQRLAGYWNFDVGAAADVTGHGHDGTLSGNAAVVRAAGDDALHAGCNRPFFTGISLQTNWPWILLTGPSGRACRIDISTNLLDWSPWVTLPNFAGSFQGLDTSATNAAQRFYRAVAQ